MRNNLSHESIKIIIDLKMIKFILFIMFIVRLLIFEIVCCICNLK